MAIAYGLLCHGNPGYVAELIGALYRPEDHYVIHVDRKGPAALYGLAAGLAARHRNIQLVPSLLCSWGGYSLVSATLDAIALAVQSPGWEHFVLLSEQHVPLMPPDDIARRLEPGTSYMAAVRLAGSDGELAAGIRHRFAMRYRELPGVGGFGAGMRGVRADWLADLYFGSQWIVLAREAAERLAAVRDHPLLAPVFAESLLPDETAIQTLLLGTPLGAGLRFDGFNPTYVALPKDGGTVDMELTEPAVRAAQAQHRLFIRKRPEVLPHGLATAIASWSRIAPVVPAPGAAAPTQAVVELAGRVGQILGARFPQGHFEVLNHPSPFCYLRVRMPGLPAAVTVNLLSENMRDFKVVVAWHMAFQDDFAPVAVGAYPATWMQVRVRDLFFAREVHLLPDRDHGFVTIAHDEDVAGLAGMLAEALERARGLVVP